MFYVIISLVVIQSGHVTNVRMHLYNTVKRYAVTHVRGTVNALYNAHTNHFSISQ